LLTPHRAQLPSPLPAHATQLPFVPFREALANAAALVHHGGIGTCAQAFAAGVPQLVVPISPIYDQTNNAARVERLGAGIVTPRKRFRANDAINALEVLLRSRAIAQRCGAIARDVDSRAPNLDTAVAAIEAHGAHAGYNAELAS
jgi:UDP:flavonoid glycosyltransferase YjiC (YdhE family)